MSSRTRDAAPTIVVGRGIVGLISALRLAEKGKKVLVLGRKSLPKSASLAATGVSAMRGLVMPNTEIFRQKLRGHHQLPGFIAKLEKTSGVDIPHKFNGVFEFFRDEETYRNLRKRIYHRHPSGLFAFKCLNFEQTRERLAEFSSREGNFEKIAAFFYPHDGWFDPACLLAALEQRLRQLGIMIIDEYVDKIVLGHKRELQILTSSGAFTGGAVLVAAGAESENLLRRSGMFCYEFSYSSGVALQTKSRIMRGVLAIKNGADSLLMSEGFARFGAENINACYEYSDEELRAAKARLQIKFKRLIAGILKDDLLNEKSVDDENFTMGVRAKIKGSEEPWVGFSPFLHDVSRGVWVATGMHKSGYYIALPCAEKLCEMMEGG